MYSEHLKSHTTHGWFDVRDFGATGEPGCNNSGEIQKALNAARDEGGGTVFFPAGVYDICSGPLMVHAYTNLLGVAPKATKLRAPEHAENGLFVIADAARYFSFKSMSVTSHNGHLWESPGGCSEGVIFDVIGTCYGEDYSLWHQVGDANWINMLIIHNEFSVYAPKSVPAWNVVTEQRGLNGNLFQKCRLIDLGERRQGNPGSGAGTARGTGQYFFHFERRKKNLFVYDNAFRDLSFEQTTGGEIRLLSAKNCIIDNCHGYDYHHNGDVVNDLIFIGASNGNDSSEHVVISNSGRRGRSRAIGLRDDGGPVDIRLASAKHTVLDNINTTPDHELTIDVGDSCTTEMRNLPKTGIILGCQ